MTRVFKLNVKFLGANRLLVFFCDFQLGIIEFVGGAQKKNTDGVSGLTQEFYKRAIRCSAPVDRRQNGKSVAIKMRCGVKGLPKCETVSGSVCEWLLPESNFIEPTRG